MNYVKVFVNEKAAERLRLEAGESLTSISRYALSLIARAWGVSINDLTPGAGKAVATPTPAPPPPRPPAPKSVPIPDRTFSVDIEHYGEGNGRKAGPWAKAFDVCGALGISTPDLLSQLDEEDVSHQADRVSISEVGIQTAVAIAKQQGLRTGDFERFLRKEGITC